MIEIRVGAKNDGDRSIVLYAEKWATEDGLSRLLEVLELDLPSGTSLTRSMENSSEREDAMAELFAAGRDLISIALKQLTEDGLEGVTEDPFWQARFFPGSQNELQ